jgi:hypothetical protein
MRGDARCKEDEEKKRDNAGGKSIYIEGQCGREVDLHRGPSAKFGARQGSEGKMRTDLGERTLAREVVCAVISKTPLRARFTLHAS